MRIEFDENPTNIIASDDADGVFSERNGVIVYLGPGEVVPWYVNACPAKFKQSVAAYESYVLEVLTESSEESQLKVVVNFEQAILEIDDCYSKEKSYWKCVVQQAKDGHL